MRIMSYNVNGIRAAEKKGLFDLIESEKPDIVCLNEVKCFKSQAPLSSLSKDYTVLWSAAERAGYSGTAMFTKKVPLSVDYAPLSDEFNHEGRIISAEFESFYMIAVYTPNAGDGLKRLDFRLSWDEEFRNYIKGLSEKKPVIVAGDLNVAHNEIDLKNPATNHNNPGFTDDERNSFSSLLSAGFKDTFRTLYSDKVEYSWYSYRFKAREKGIGWRIDYFLVSDDIMPLVKDSTILQSATMSDHQPIFLEIDIK